MKAYFETGSGMVIETDTPSAWESDANARKLGKAEGDRRIREEARARLLGLVKPGDTLYTVLRHVSSSGMSRRIDVYAIQDNQPVYLSGYASRVLGWRMGPNRDGGIVVGGCGMDMGFHLVYSLSAALFPNHGKDGGYALSQRWL